MRPTRPFPEPLSTPLIYYTALHNKGWVEEKTVYIYGHQMAINADKVVIMSHIKVTVTQQFFY